MSSPDSPVSPASPDAPRARHGDTSPPSPDALNPLGAPQRHASALRHRTPATVPDPHDVHVPEQLRQEIEAHMSLYPDPTSAALPALAAAQRVHGWCSPEAIEQVACVMQVTPASLAAVATFYDMLETSPVGQHSVYVCTNISCSLRGADALFAEVQAAARKRADSESQLNVRAFECLGACDIAPMASVDGVYVGPLTTEDIEPMLDDVLAGRPVLPDKQLAVRLVADPNANSRPFPPHPVQAPQRHDQPPLALEHDE